MVQNSHDEPNIEAYGPTSDKPHAKTPSKHIVDTLVFSINVTNIFDENDDSYNDLREENPQSEEPEDHGQESVEVDQLDEEDDVPIVNIMKRIIESITKPQEKVVALEVEDVDQETKSDETLIRTMTTGMKQKKRDASTNNIIRIIKKKTPKRTHVSKKRKVEEKVVMKKSLKRNLVQTSDIERDIEAGIQRLNLP
ncbi:unnamed protein product [Vicia faba]|uniref:Uncharacterized protein n=1 Tax=Vicia faba TaxID=3906 RepID=A0AAV1AYW0_VICFA|nr:unnamed protein product [Vicia faba]